MALLLSRQRSALRTYVKEALPDVAAPARGRVTRVVELIASGWTWNKASAHVGVSWPEMRILTSPSRYPRFYELWQVVRAVGEEGRKQTRLDAAHDRAVNGWLEPVYHKGEVCGHVRRFSDRLLELLLKADDPEKFADRQKVEQTGKVLVMNIDLSASSELDGPSSIDVTPDGDEAAPGPGETPEIPENTGETP